jgi:hypothetical protein
MYSLAEILISTLSLLSVRKDGKKAVRVPVGLPDQRRNIVFLLVFLPELRRTLRIGFSPTGLGHHGNSSRSSRDAVIVMWQWLAASRVLCGGFTMRRIR